MILTEPGGGMKLDIFTVSSWGLNAAGRDGLNNSNRSLPQTRRLYQNRWQKQESSVQTEASVVP